MWAHITPLCGHIQQLCPLTDIKHYWKTLSGHMLIGVSNKTETHTTTEWTRITTVWAHTTTVWVNWLQCTTGNQLSLSMFIRGSPPPKSKTYITTVWVHITTMWAQTTTVWVSWLQHYWKTNIMVNVYQRFPTQNKTQHNQFVGTHNHCVGTQ